MGTPDGEGLGPYRLLSTLGAGGFGEVHLALDPEGRTVAVKILHPHVAADTTALARLAREVETMRRVQGPHIAEVLDASMTGPRPYLVTRYVQGRPLSAVIAAGAVEGDGLARLAYGLAEALVAIHAADVVHRDLKPANVILTDGEPVVIDFGIACALDSVSVTASGAVLGTPGYLAPEVLEGTDAGPAADLFSLGATLAHAATGRPPYGVGPPSAVGYRVVHHDPDLEGVPGWLAPLLAGCLRRDPSARPSAPELLAALEAEPRVAALSVPPAPPAPPARRVRPVLAAAGAAEAQAAEAAEAQATGARGRRPASPTPPSASRGRRGRGRAARPGHPRVASRAETAARPALAGGAARAPPRRTAPPLGDRHRAAGRAGRGDGAEPAARGVAAAAVGVHAGGDRRRGGRDVRPEEPRARDPRPGRHRRDPRAVGRARRVLQHPDPRAGPGHRRPRRGGDPPGLLTPRSPGSFSPRANPG
ncbi:protein kinase domain-containing protein [Streptosporangium sandarakinum]|uniref:serine/threonine-protein kinase n=1 Tax=Streptosporangium sandarakinum TaxID=1260955 RepID=UPI003D8D49A0